MLARFGMVSGLGVLVCISMVLAQPPGGQPGGGPGGFGGPPKFGQVLPGFMQERLQLSAEQKKQLEELQKDVDTRLGKVLTAGQKKSLEQPGPGFGGGPGKFGPGGFGPLGGGPGGPGGFGPGGFMGVTRFDDVKKRIDATDEEWQVIGPKLKNVLAARQIFLTNARGVEAGFDGGAKKGPDQKGGPGPGGPGPGGPGGQQGANSINQAQAELKAVLDDPKHSQGEVQELVAAVRAARTKARANLDAAQQEVLRLVTSKQEAVLVSLGFLE